MVLGLKIPKLKVSGDGSFTKFLMSNEVIAVGSAILLTPIIMTAITGLIGRVPFLRDHFAVGMIVASFFLFALSATFSGMFRAIVLGLSAGVLLVGIQSTSIAQGFLSKLEEVVP